MFAKLPVSSRQCCSYKLYNLFVAHAVNSDNVCTLIKQYSAYPYIRTSIYKVSVLG